VHLRIIQLTSHEFASFLRARHGDWGGLAESDDCRTREHLSGAQVLTNQIERLERAISEADLRGTFWQKEAEIAATRAASLEAEIVTLKTALEEAQIQREKLRQEAEAAAKQTGALLADLFEVTSELLAERCEAVRGLR
jgi:chromosome segregation ATPase